MRRGAGRVRCRPDGWCPLCKHRRMVGKRAKPKLVPDAPDLPAQFDRAQPGPSGTVPYWTVPDVDATVRQWSEQGASAHRGPKTIMTGERLCQMLDPFGNLF